MYKAAEGFGNRLLIVLNVKLFKSSRLLDVSLECFSKKREVENHKKKTFHKKLLILGKILKNRE
jgi:hypothetical protein